MHYYTIRHLVLMQEFRMSVVQRRYERRPPPKSFVTTKRVWRAERIQTRQCSVCVSFRWVHVGWVPWRRFRGETNGCVIVLGTFLFFLPRRSVQEERSRALRIDLEGRQRPAGTTRRVEVKSRGEPVPVPEGLVRDRGRPTESSTTSNTTNTL